MPAHQTGVGSLKSLCHNSKLKTSKFIGEPQLGKRGLYPTTSKLYKGKHPARTRMDIISYCDSENNIFQICEKVNTNLALVIQELKQLKERVVQNVKKVALKEEWEFMKL